MKKLPFPAAGKGAFRVIGFCGGEGETVLGLRGEAGAYADPPVSLRADSPL